MTNSYSDCYFCGGEVVEQPMHREVWWKGQLHLIDNVPIGVCQQCGQKVILPSVAKTIDLILTGATQPDTFVQVPTYHFRQTERVA